MSNGDSKVNLKEVGFTIFETMIVLAVTGALFVAIAATLSGRQNEAEFIHAIQDAQAHVQQVINQVSDGYYSSNNNFSCTNNSNIVTINPGNNTQGTNFGCELLGSVIQFGVLNTSPEQYQIYTIAGLQGSTAGANSPYQNADPTVVQVGGNFANYTVTKSLEYGLTTSKMQINNGGSTPPTPIGAVGFLMEPGSSSGGISGYNSGTQSIDLVPIYKSNLNLDPASMSSAIEASLKSLSESSYASINPPNGVQICMVSGATNQSGLITIGNSNGSLLATLSIKSNRNCS